jgi:cellulose synthase/poly-beta-1,6-N-acetylglucosamine synthase-like glycosyltransferase
MTGFEFYTLMAAAAVLAAYMSFTFRFRRGYNHPEPLPASGKPMVSVVIAARNEENRIGALLTGLMNQSYPASRFEVIVIDDDSEDRTRIIVQEFTEKTGNIRLLRAQNRATARSPKKNALQQAIDAASGDIILTTDADCLVAQYWVESMVAQFRPGVDFVAGFSRTWITDWNKANSAQKFEHLDFFAGFAVAGGALLSGWAFTCSGQNLGFRKTGFTQVGGYSKIAHVLSGDDVHLMHLFRMAGLGITFTRNRHTLVYTRPISGWTALINQRARWASNSSRMAKTMPIFFLYLTIAFLLNIGLPYVVIVSPGWGLALVGIKALSDYRFLRGLCATFQIESRRLRFFPVWFVVQPLYMIAAVGLGLPGLFRWQGRSPVKGVQ